MQKTGIHIVHELPDFNPEIQYTFRYICNHPLLRNILDFSTDSSSWPVYYGIKPPAHKKALFIPCQKFIFSDRNISNDLYYCNKYTFEDTTLYSIERSEKKVSKSIIKGKEFSFDILESIFFHISRYEEYHATATDINVKTGWLKEELHFFVQNNIEKIPVVDHLIATIGKILTSQSILHEVIFSLTHDIDILYKFKPHFRFYRSLIGGVYHKRGFNYIFRTIHQFLNTFTGRAADPYNTFDFLFVHHDYFMYKLVFLMTGGETKYDNKYSHTDPVLNDVISIAKNQGYEIGLHPSFNAAQKLSLHVAEKANLEKLISSECKHNRQHWLRWVWEDTPHHIEKLGFQLDSSLGYTDRIGFRCGTGFPYKLYDFSRRRAFHFTELPLIFMESALVKEHFRSKKSILTISSEFHLKNRYNTIISYNFHNSNFDDSLQGHEDMRFLYDHIINYCLSKI